MFFFEIFLIKVFSLKIYIFRKIIMFLKKKYYISNFLYFEMWLLTKIFFKLKAFPNVTRKGIVDSLSSMVSSDFPIEPNLELIIDS